MLEINKLAEIVETEFRKWERLGDEEITKDGDMARMASLALAEAVIAEARRLAASQKASGENTRYLTQDWKDGYDCACDHLSENLRYSLEKLRDCMKP